MPLLPHTRAHTMTLVAFKEQFDKQLALFIAKKIASARLQTTNTDIQSHIAHAGELAMRGGKRVRPYIAYISYLLSGGTNEAATLDALIGVELFHTFALIHDDIIDRGAERHGVATIHEIARPTLTDTQLAQRIGEAQALLVGDLVFAWSQEALFSRTSPEQMQVRTLFDRMVEEVIVGQMIDVSLTAKSTTTMSEIEEKNRLKTSQYSFVSPLKIGTALATTSQEYDSFFEAFGTALGAVYQIQDDLLDITGDPKKTGKDTFRDLQAGQHTFFTQYVFEHGTEREQTTLLSLFRKKLTTEEQKVAIALFTESGSIAAGRAIIEKELAQAQALLQKANIAAPYTEALQSLIEMIRGRAA